MRSSVISGLTSVVVALAMTGCFSDADGWNDGEDSGIVFGVEQRVDPTTGASEVTGGYELLRVGGRGFDVASVDVPGGSCSLEDLAKRRGRGRIDSGRAVFSGGGLPGAGLVVRATDTEVVRAQGASWKAGDRVNVDIDGFAMPPLRPFSLKLPAPGLAVTAPPATDAITVKATDPITVTWSAADADRDTVMVALSTGASRDATAGIQLRCFFEREAGTATIPRELVASFVNRASTATGAIGGSVTGRFVVASHRQATFAGRGDWIAYVVATSVAREQPFSVASR